MDGAEIPLNFDVLPSFANGPRSITPAVSTAGPYLVIEGTLDECMSEFMAKPELTRHLYEI